MTLRQQLRAWVKMRQAYPPRHPVRFSCIESLVLQCGRKYVATESPHTPMPRMCFQASYRLATRARSPWIYVEGYAISPVLGLAVSHAWLTRAEQPSRAFEVAWEKAGVEYLGIPFRADYVRQVFQASRRRFFSVLDAPWMRYPLVTGEHKIEEVRWQAITLEPAEP